MTELATTVSSDAAADSSGGPDRGQIERLRRWLDGLGPIDADIAALQPGGRPLDASSYTTLAGGIVDHAHDTRRWTGRHQLLLERLAQQPNVSTNSTCITELHQHNRRLFRAVRSGDIDVTDDVDIGGARLHISLRYLTFSYGAMLAHCDLAVIVRLQDGCAADVADVDNFDEIISHVRQLPSQRVDWRPLKDTLGPQLNARQRAALAVAVDDVDELVDELAAGNSAVAEELCHPQPVRPPGACEAVVDTYQSTWPEQFWEVFTTCPVAALRRLGVTGGQAGEGASCDPANIAVLWDHWSGTLGELRDAAQQIEQRDRRLRPAQ